MTNKLKDIVSANADHYTIVAQYLFPGNVEISTTMADDEGFDFFQRILEAFLHIATESKAYAAHEQSYFRAVDEYIDAKKADYEETESIRLTGSISVT